MAPPKLPPNYCVILGDMALLLLVDKFGGSVAWATIDRQDLRRIRKHRWHLSKNGYVATDIFRHGKKHTLSLHRCVLSGYTKCPGTIDHKDGNPLNNCRSNIRAATPSQNAMNRKGTRSASGYKGVHRCSGGYVARIGREGKRFYLGFYSTPEEAAFAYNTAALELFGEFACLNAIRL